ncbi:hypothetical protein QBC35DRAFT_200178 [Podospora australis]|uniref:Uncharacterized protein n=1 Tax=Podospora australis TaxID=1536484 RepID=A0AAN6X5X4_9PEZI|nr:hypothetical protein QBC35DRAFT_200178 [Podospora australis]
MSVPNGDGVNTIQKVLEPYMRPRDEVANIRRILALHLNSCVQISSVAKPLALVDGSELASPATAQGLQRQYLEALNANIKARNEFKTHSRELGGNRGLEDSISSDDTKTNQDYLQEHMAVMGLQKKQERLRAVEKHLELLRTKPAASPGFMDPGEIFKDSRSLPSVPKELFTAIALDTTTSATQLKSFIDQLEKNVLQAKLSLKREEQLLEQAKARSTSSPENVTDSAKLEALNRTRVELISWIESELSKASGDGADSGGGDDHRRSTRKMRASIDPVNMDDQLASIKDKYTQYTEARKALLQLVNQQPKPIIKPLTQEQLPPQTGQTATPVPSAHLLAPYFEQLLSVSREQKGLITQKSHLNNTVTKQVKENCQILDHLAEESQLIPAYPMPGAGRPKAGFTGTTAGSAEASQASSRIKPWVYAADAAKIATLEAVAEKIEEGQLALEGSMQALAEINMLLGRDISHEQDGVAGEDAGDEDMWMNEGQSPGKGTGMAGEPRRHTINRRESRADQGNIKTGTVWDMLDGNLGLLRSEKDLP